MSQSRRSNEGPSAYWLRITPASRAVASALVKCLAEDAPPGITIAEVGIGVAVFLAEWASHLRTIAPEVMPSAIQEVNTLAIIAAAIVLENEEEKIH